MQYSLVQSDGFLHNYIGGSQDFLGVIMVNSLVVFIDWTISKLFKLRDLLC